MTTPHVNYPEQLAQIQGRLKTLAQDAPSMMAGFSALHGAAVGSGALDAKTKELIALAIAVSARCDGCIAFHTHDALQAGASRAEITDALGVAVLMGGEPALMYATHVQEAMDQFESSSTGR